ncbi:ABC transporter ATP-binding protein [Haloquadratum walsbyi]|uniref:Molybdate/tungstate import ATP-binding protein WtpC n=1 Tax=Haloquadratum walsbyi J07HQW2 TaxID=1238425 RepID=U1PXJ5_9EURY|nr:ABC transporter ATP-binding protein [Haloquadratum walsbyi]ERG97186.1 MAG: ABC-type spermidine/putrescine transport system, ATPase component [Haloquadratum walsbyi J07HQW2]
MTHLSADIRSTFTADGAEPFTVDAAMEVDAGETCVILGPSGSGKTLLLETIAGFHQHTGIVRTNRTDITDQPPEKRGFGFVFQDYALFPHMTVRDNVNYGTQYRESSRDADALLAELGVAHLADRNPPTLSGGEKQRVALARALAIRPSVMLLDEPLAALDVPTRKTLRDDLADILTDVTAVYVTHNRTTARAIADHIIVMQHGDVIQRGTPEDVFEHPQSPMVARFTGSNVIDLSTAPALRRTLANDTKPQARFDGSSRSPIDHGKKNADNNNINNIDINVTTHVAIRPEAITLDDTNGDLSGTVERVVHEDATNRVTVAFDNVTIETFASSPPTVGTELMLSFPRDRLHPC